LAERGDLTGPPVHPDPADSGGRSPADAETILALPRSEAPALFGDDRAPQRATIYWIVGLLMVAGAIVLRASPWRTGAALHNVVEAIATILAFVVGALALVRFYSRKQSTFLFIGTGFLGTGVLDGYHALISSQILAIPQGTELADASVWSWTASRVFLGLFLVVSHLAWRREEGGGGMAVREGSVYATAIVLTLAIFTFFVRTDLRSAYFPAVGMTRPGETLPALLFGMAFVGYLRKGAWRRDWFDHWLIVSLLIALLDHAVYISQSRELYDAMYDAGHALKLASYLAVLSGLMISVYVTFRREGQAMEAVQGANDALAREVAVRREAERILQESEERLQNFLDTAHDLIQSTTPDGRLLYVNRAWEWTVGYEAGEALEMGLADVLSPACMPDVDAAIQHALDGEPVPRMDLEFVSADGQTVVCSGSLTVHRVGGTPVTVQAILRDVTEQRRAERELAASQANVEALVENTGEAIWSVGLDHRLITFNSAFALAIEARTGREPSKGDAPEHIFEPEVGEWHRELYRRTLRGERFSEERQEAVQGQLRYMEIFCNPIHDEKGIAGAVMFGRDITPRKRAEEAMVMAKEEAIAADRAKSQFLANMSHELRTPLNSVIGFANILLKNKKGNLEDKQMGFLTRILTNGRHLLALINEVLDLAKIEAGRMELEIEPTDLAELVGETLGQLEGRVTERDVALVAAVPEGLNPLDTDASKLKQVIINLVGNALKFTEHGSVTVRAIPAADGVTPAALAVEDTGIGIPEDRLQAIFDAFQQADGTTSRKYGGTGLGLAISRSICQLLGYHVDVTSVVGEGSTFTIHLGAPAPHPDPEEPGARAQREQELSPEEARQSMSTHAIRDFKVLVVDDELDSRVLMAHLLEDFGCTVLNAASGEEGIEMAREHRPDLITLDLMMPGMTGWEALRVLKDDDDLREIPVVVVSIVAKEGGRGRLLGAVDLITKPVEREALLRVLWRNLVRQKGGRVLLVEDDDATREVLEEYLTEAGLEVRGVSNGLEALQAVEQEAPDAVLLDLMMPVMDGMTFLDRLRDNPYHAGLPVIVLTAKDLTAEEKEQLAEKASGVIMKGESVEERLREVLGSLFPLSPGAKSPDD
jgi:PAS domain S-box-containing protein